jgi:hypothetical protein
VQVLTQRLRQRLRLPLLLRLELRTHAARYRTPHGRAMPTPYPRTPGARMPKLSLSTAAYLELALEAARSGDHPRMVGSLLSIPDEELSLVEVRLVRMVDVESSPLAAAVLAIVRTSIPR